MYDLPYGVYVHVVSDEMMNGLKGSVRSNRDGSYTILINARLNDVEQKNTCIHEVAHIMNGDFEKGDVQEVECNVHRMQLTI